MDKEIIELLEKEIKLVNQSKLKVIIGVGLLITNIVLLLMGVLNISTLIFTLILLFSYQIFFLLIKIINKYNKSYGKVSIMGYGKLWGWRVYGTI